MLPLTDPEPAGLSAAPLSVPYGLGWRGAKGGGSGRCRAGEGESGLGITVPKYASFFIFVFLKKYRLCYQEEEERTFLILSGMAPKIPRGGNR